MAEHNVENQLEPSLQCEPFPWKLVPIDLERPVKEKANITVVSPPQTPEPIQSVPCTLPRSTLEVELPDASYMMIKSMLSHIDLQDKNTTFFAADASNQPESLSPIPKPASSVRTSLKEDASSRPISPPSSPGRISSKIGIKHEPQFTKRVCKHPRRYDVKEPSYRDKKEKKKSSTTIGETFGMTDDDCQTKRKSLREKTNHEMKQFVADEDRVSNKTMQFRNNMSSIPYHNRTGTKRRNISGDRKSPESASTKRKKSNSASENLPDPKSSANLRKSKNFVGATPCLDNQTPVQEEPKTPNESAAKIDQLFADTIALELSRRSPKLKNILKAKIWQPQCAQARPSLWGGGFGVHELPSPQLERNEDVCI